MGLEMEKNIIASGAVKLERGSLGPAPDIKRWSTTPQGSGSAAFDALSRELGLESTNCTSGIRRPTWSARRG